jgi:hypothetical protein
MKFSERTGHAPVKTQIQVNTIDKVLRNSLWNKFIENFLNKVDIEFDYEKNEVIFEKQHFLKNLWKDFLNKPIDEIPFYDFEPYDIVEHSVLYYLKSWYFTAEWFEVYDFIEMIAEIDKEVRAGFIDECNKVLKKEVAGYRIIDGRVAQINAKEEIQEVEEALSSTDKFKSVNTHLHTALDMLADRKSPDYRNSIKESISAVESLCKIITNDDGTTLGKALTVIDNKFPMHQSLRKAFSALYGYASDESGIRHSLDETGATIGFEEAKFMLVTCSAFINYLKNKMAI